MITTVKIVNISMPSEMPLIMLCWVAQSCPTLCNPMDCSQPGSSVHGDSPGKNTGVGCHALLQRIFPTWGSNTGLLYYRWILYCLSHQGSPREALAHVYWRKNRKSTSVERWAKPREALAPEWCSTRGFQDRAFKYSRSWAWTDSFDEQLQFK